MVMRKFGRVPAYQSGEALRRDIEQTVVPEHMVTLWNIGQVGTVLKWPADANGKATIVAIDPYLTRSMEERQPETAFVREYDPPLTPEDLCICDAVLITHHHDDHLDIDTLQRLHQANTQVQLIIPTPHISRLLACQISAEVIVPADAGELLQVAGIDILPIAAAHTEYETDDGHHVFLGYTLSATGTSSLETARIYHSGDTIVTEKLVEEVARLHPHIVLLPINGEDYFRTHQNIIGNMSDRAAVHFAHTVGADLVIPNHYDMFANNRDNPAHFVDYVFHEQPDLKFHMLSVGERFFYCPPTT